MTKESSGRRQSSMNQKTPSGRKEKVVEKVVIDSTLDFEDEASVVARRTHAQQCIGGPRSENIKGESSKKVKGKKKGKKTGETSGGSKKTIKGKKRKAVVSMKENVEKKGKGKKKDEIETESEYEDTMQPIFPSLRIRTSPKSLLAAIRCLSYEEKECVIEMGFGSLLSFQIDELPAKLMYFVLDKFDDKKMAIRLENGDIPVTAE